MNGKKVEVCGLSDLDAALFLAEQVEQEGVTLTPSQMGKDAANAVLAEASAKLAQSISPHEQAVGLYVQAYQAETAAIEEGVNARNCKGDARCRSDAWQPQPQVRAAVAEPLVKMALAGRDPAIYATAMYACRSAPMGACAAISYAGWATIEPDNAAVWLMMANEAALRKDLPARDEAMRRAATASEYDARIPSLTTLFESEPVKAQPPLMQWLVGVSLASISASAWPPPYVALSSYCLRSETADPARTTVCDKLANKLLEKDQGFVGRRLASQIGERFGWDAARTQRLRDEYAVEFALAFDVGLTGNAYRCENLAKELQWGQKVLSKGERAIALERIAASGKAVAVLAEELRKTRPELFK